MEEEKIFFKNDHPVPIPNVMWWYYMEKYIGSGIPLNADLCNKWLNEDLKVFFEKYPDELYKADLKLVKQSDLELYKKEIGGLICMNQ